MTIKLQTVAPEIRKVLDPIIDAGVLLPFDGEVMQGIMRTIEQLGRVQRDDSLWLRAQALQMTGDIEGALKSVAECKKFDPLNRIILLLNHGRCSEAQELYIEACAPESGRFSESLLMGIGSGAFHKIAEFGRRAEEIRLKGLESVDLERFYMADKMLTEFGIEDQVAADLMGTAGTVMIEHGLIFLGEGPHVEVIDVPGELRSVHLTYRLAATASRAVEIYLAFIDRLLDSGKTIPNGFHISFEGVA